MAGGEVRAFPPAAANSYQLPAEAGRPIRERRSPSSTGPAISPPPSAATNLRPREYEREVQWEPRGLEEQGVSVQIPDRPSPLAPPDCDCGTEVVMAKKEDANCAFAGHWRANALLDTKEGRRRARVHEEAVMVPRYAGPCPVSLSCSRFPFSSLFSLVPFVFVFCSSLFPLLSLSSVLSFFFLPPHSLHGRHLHILVPVRHLPPHPEIRLQSTFQEQPLQPPDTAQIHRTPPPHRITQTPFVTAAC